MTPEAEDAIVEREIGAEAMAVLVRLAQGARLCEEGPLLRVPLPGLVPLAAGRLALARELDLGQKPKVFVLAQECGPEAFGHRRRQGRAYPGRPGGVAGVAGAEKRALTWPIATRTVGGVVVDAYAGSWTEIEASA
jgi:hypothetical protein